MTEVLHTLKSSIRGGGVVGSRAWVAKIVGKDEKFGFKREFIRKGGHTSGSGRSGTLLFEITDPGIYEFRGLGSDDLSISMQSANGGVSGFIEVTDDGKAVEISKSTVAARF